MNKVSVDFDSTLSLKSVQDYVKSLINKGYDVWVVTSRVPDGSDPKYKQHGIWVPIDNSDLFKVTDKLGIKREKIIFTSHELKSKVINEMKLDFIFHLDDDWVEVGSINRETNIEGISCFGTSDWKKKCNEVLNKF